jgi:hypothetical protein
MASEIDGVKLQLAMAFGQGAGAMLADPTALEKLLAEKGTLLDKALKNWDASRFAFTELVRTLGQVSATRAAARKGAAIMWTDIEESLPDVLELCPCEAVAQTANVQG